MKIDKIRLSKTVRRLSFLGQVSVVITFICVLLLEFEILGKSTFILNLSLLFLILVTFFVGCLGAVILFFNRAHIRLTNPDFTFLMLVCILPMAIFQYAYGLQNVNFERVNDVSTNVIDAPQFKLSRLERQGSYSSMAAFLSGYGIQNGLMSARTALNQISAHPDIATVNFLIPPDLLYRCAMITAQNLNWKVSFRDLAAQIFEAKTSVRSLHNNLDTVFRIRDAGQGGSSIDIRSASAHTFLDGGLNAYVIKRFMTALRSTLADRRNVEYC